MGQIFLQMEVDTRRGPITIDPITRLTQVVCQVSDSHDKHGEKRLLPSSDQEMKAGWGRFVSSCFAAHG